MHPRTAPGEIVCAIGDIHGRLDLFMQLIETLQADPVRYGANYRTRVIVLGDFIDRGPAIRQLLAALMAAERQVVGFEVLLGNHEAVLLDSLAGDSAAQKQWTAFGGRATLESLGISERAEGEHPLAFAARLAAALGNDTIEWLEDRPTSARSGDFFFCHAGVRPGVPLERQGRDDLIWIRDPFLNSQRNHGAVIVHGHSIVPAPLIRFNRIGLDTGAYRTDVLTAICLCDDQAYLYDTSKNKAT